MANRTSSGGAGESEPNPYAAPGADLRPLAEGGSPGSVRGQPVRHLGLEWTFRLGGLFGLVLSSLLFAFFVVWILFQYYTITARDGQMLNKYTARLLTVGLCFLSILALAVATNWSLFRLRRWGRSALSVAVVVPAPMLALSYFADLFFPGAGPRNLIDLGHLGTVFGLSVGYGLPLLWPMWSAKGRAVFAPGYGQVGVRASRQRPGCLAILGALGFVLAEAIAFTIFVLAVVTLLEVLVLSRPVGQGRADDTESRVLSPSIQHLNLIANRNARGCQLGDGGRDGSFGQIVAEVTVESDDHDTRVMAGRGHHEVMQIIEISRQHGYSSPDGAGQDRGVTLGFESSLDLWTTHVLVNEHFHSGAVISIPRARSLSASRSRSCSMSGRFRAT